MNKQQFKKIVREEVKNVLRERFLPRDMIRAKASMNRMGHLKLEFEYDGYDVDTYIQYDRQIEEYIYDHMFPYEDGLDSKADIEEKLKKGYTVEVGFDKEVARIEYQQWLDNL